MLCAIYKKEFIRNRIVRKILWTYLKCIITQSKFDIKMFWYDFIAFLWTLNSPSLPKYLKTSAYNKKRMIAKVTSYSSTMSFLLGLRAIETSPFLDWQSRDVNKVKKPFDVNQVRRYSKPPITKVLLYYFGNFFCFFNVWWTSRKQISLVHTFQNVYYVEIALVCKIKLFCFTRTKLLFS